MSEEREKKLKRIAKRLVTDRQYLLSQAVKEHSLTEEELQRVIRLITIVKG